MAGDWIKMREGLHEDPAVVAIAERLNTRPEHVVGYCHRFWSWVSRNCYDGSVTGVTLDALGGVLNLPMFPQMLRDVGWLEYDETGIKPRITIPKFDRHLSQGAKARALASERVRNARVTKTLRRKRNKTVTREEKRRIDISKDISDDFSLFWEAYPSGRKQSKAKAREAFKAALTKTDAATILAAVKEYARSDVGRGQFVKMPATWLNQECWQDDRESWRDRNGAAPSSQTEYRKISREEFSRLWKAGEFFSGPWQDKTDANGYYRAFGTLKNGRKVESHTDPNWSSE